MARSEIAETGDRFYGLKSHAKHEEFELDLEGGRKPFKD